MKGAKKKVPWSSKSRGERLRRLSKTRQPNEIGKNGKKALKKTQKSSIPATCKDLFHKNDTD